MAVRSDQLLEPVDVVATITLLLREHFAPDASDSVDQDVALFLQLKRTTRSIGEYLSKFDLLRRKAEARMQMSWSFSDTSAAISCLRYSQRAWEFGDRCSGKTDETTLWPYRQFRTTGCAVGDGKGERGRKILGRWRLRSASCVPHGQEKYGEREEEGWAKKEIGKRERGGGKSNGMNPKDWQEE